MMQLSSLKMRQQTKQFLSMKMQGHHLKKKTEQSVREIKIKVESLIKMKMKKSKPHKLKMLSYLKFCGKLNK